MPVDHMFSKATERRENRKLTFNSTRTARRRFLRCFASYLTHSEIRPAALLHVEGNQPFKLRRDSTIHEFAAANEGDFLVVTVRKS